MSNDNQQEAVARIVEMLALGPETEWQEHDGTGRPHPPTSFVEVERFNKTRYLIESASQTRGDDRG